MSFKYPATDIECFNEAEIAALRAEVERLRGALIKLASDEGWDPTQVMEIARTALERKP